MQSGIRGWWQARCARRKAHEKALCYYDPPSRLDEFDGLPVKGRMRRQRAYRPKRRGLA